MNRSISLKGNRFFSLAVPLGAVIFAVLQFLLGCLPSVWGSSEAREAHVVSLMRETGEFILPLRNGLVPSKPPLFHWAATALTYLSPFDAVVAARWISTLAALAVLLLAARLAGIFAGLVFPLDYISRSRAQWLTPGLLVCSYGFIAVAVDARVDMMLSAFILAAVSGLIGRPTQAELREGVEDREQGKRFLLFFLFAGAGCLTKGPLGFVLPALIGASWHFSIYGARKTFKLWMTPRIGWGIFLAIALPWYFLAALKGGDGFLGRQILFENVTRLLGGEFVNTQPWYFYGRVFLQISAPWSVVFLGITLTYITRAFRVERGLARNAHWEVFGFLLLWFWIGVLLFSCASGKRPGYLLPLLPAQAIAVALAMVGGFSRLRPAGELRLLWVVRSLLVVIIVVLVSAVSVAEILALPQSSLLVGFPYWPAGIIPALRVVQAIAGALLVAGFILLPRLWRRSDYTVAAVLVALGVIIGSATALGFTAKGAIKGFQSIAQQVGTAVPLDARLTVIRSQMDEYFDPILYYLGRPADLQDPAKLDLNCPGFTLAKKEWFAERPATASGVPETVFSTTEWLSKIRNDSRNEIVLTVCR